jgi:ribonuclease III
VSAVAADPALDALSQRLGYQFSDLTLLRQAMRHRSWCSEHPGHDSNERLEFLGDAVLGWVVADVVYRQHLDSHEGRLTDLRKSVVNASALAEIAASIDIGSCLMLGKGEAAAGGRAKPSILSDALEAAVAAVYLDGGPRAAHDLIERLLGDRLTSVTGLAPYTDFKTTLQELSARQFDTAPVYVVREEGPDHAKRFFATVLVSGDVVGEGHGTSKKQAEQRAARRAVHVLTGEPDGA